MISDTCKNPSQDISLLIPPSGGSAWCQYFAWEDARPGSWPKRYSPRDYLLPTVFPDH